MDASTHGEFIAPRVRSKRLRRVQLYLELMLLDCVAIVASFLISSGLGSGVGVFDGWQLALMALIGYLGFALAGDVYSATNFTDPRASLRRSASALLYALIAMVFFTYIVHASEQISRLAFGVGAVLALAFLTTGRVLFVRVALRRLDGSLLNELLIVDGVEALSLGIKHRLNTRAMGLSPDLDDPEMLDRIGRHLRGFDRVVVSCPVDRREAWTLLLRGANVDGEFLLSDKGVIDVLAVGRVGSHTTHIVSRGPLSTSNRAAKRGLDLAVTVPALILSAPLLLVVAIAIKLDSRGPVFFKQLRVGRGNQQFRIYKFRTMRSEQSDHAGAQSASRDDERVTGVGRFLRRTSIDELPQLLNVLEGDMSLVGPRPHALGSLAGDKLFWQVDQRYWLRHALKPGITGLAQVRGFRGATDREEDLEHRLAADLEYLRNWSIWREISILASTALVITHKNAF